MAKTASTTTDWKPWQPLIGLHRLDYRVSRYIDAAVDVVLTKRYQRRTDQCRQPAINAPRISQALCRSAKRLALIVIANRDHPQTGYNCSTASR